MAKFTKAFRGVPNGEIYPKDYAAGDECPAELEDAARSLKVLEKTAKSTDAASAPEAPAEGEAQ